MFYETSFSTDNKKFLKTSSFGSLSSSSILESTAQKFNFAVLSVVKPKASFVFKIKVPSKTIFNLILLESFNLVKCLKFTEVCSFSSFSKRQVIYTVLRAPFVYKNSREQLCFERYSGSFFAVFSITDFLIVDFIEYCFFKTLSNFFKFELRGVKKLA